jgi:hypothetical protein
MQNDKMFDDVLRNFISVAMRFDEIRSGMIDD